MIDLGLRLADVEALGLTSEPVEYRGRTDPRLNLRECGAAQAECEFLVRQRWAMGWTGERVELNAMTSPQLVEWLEAKLAAHAVTKLVPDRGVLAAAYRRAHRLRTIQEMIDAVTAAREDERIPVPRDMGARVRAVLAEKPALSWDAALWEVVSRPLTARGGV